MIVFTFAPVAFLIGYFSDRPSVSVAILLVYLLGVVGGRLL